MQQPGRMRLRQWLEEQIHSGRYPGVSWLDQSAQIFQIPWKHAARHGWSIDRDATLFRNWAVHTGRYRPDKDKPDPKTWKANFRCALNSLPDICELPEHSRKSGRNAFRVYRMMPNTPTHRRRRDLRSLSRPRRRQVSLGDGAYVTHPWQTTTAAMSDASQMLETPAGDMFGSTPAQGMWETHPEDQELTDAVVKLMDNSSNADLWSQTGEQRGWRTHTLMDQWHSAGDAYSLHVDSYSDLLGPNYVKELCDWSTPHETLMS